MLREELVKEIQKGDKKKDNRLIITKGLKFMLVPYDTNEEVEAFKKMDYLARYETFDAGNDYVGEEASKDPVFIDRLMQWAESFI